MRAGALDAYGTWLLGVVYAAQKLLPEARDCYLAAVRMRPTFWSAWKELAALTTAGSGANGGVADGAAGDGGSSDALPVYDLPQHWMRPFYDAHVALELHRSEQALDLYTALETQCVLHPSQCCC